MNLRGLNRAGGRLRASEDRFHLSCSGGRGLGEGWGSSWPRAQYHSLSHCSLRTACLHGLTVGSLTPSQCSFHSQLQIKNRGGRYLNDIVLFNFIEKTLKLFCVILPDSCIFIVHVGVYAICVYSVVVFFPNGYLSIAIKKSFLKIWKYIFEIQLWLTVHEQFSLGKLPCLFVFPEASFYLFGEEFMPLFFFTMATVLVTIVFIVYCWHIAVSHLESCAFIFLKKYKTMAVYLFISLFQ